MANLKCEIVNGAGYSAIRCEGGNSCLNQEKAVETAKNANHPKTQLGCMVVNNIQNLLFDLPPGPHVCPLLVALLAFKELQIVPHFAEEGFRLFADFLDQKLLRAHRVSLMRWGISRQISFNAFRTIGINGS